MVLAEALAITAAFFFGLSNVLTKKGLDHQDVLQAIFISLFVNAAIMWVLALFFVPLHLYLTTAIFIFVAAGCLAPGLGRLFNITAIKHIGVSKASPIIGTSPLYSVIAAIIFLGEPFSMILVVATTVIIAGIALISMESHDNKKFDIKYVWFAVGASMSYGFAAPIQKAGLAVLHYPILAATITTTTSLILLSIYLAATRQLHLTRSTRSGTIFASLAGVATCFAFLANFNALNIGTVSTVAPLLATFPLFALVLSHFMLKQHERITLRIWAGALLTLAGVIIITVF